MDQEELRMEMDLAGCVQLCHPMMPNRYWILEQKLDKNHDFVPIEQGAYVFQIIENERQAIRSGLENLDEIHEFLEQRIEKEGWQMTDIDIPKKNYVKWQLCSRVF